MLPFDQFELKVTKDRRIFCVRAQGYAPDHGADSEVWKQALISLLSEKYGLRHPSQVESMSRLKSVGDDYYFGTVDRTAYLNIYEKNLFTLEYYDGNLRSIYYDEQESKSKKNEADKKAALRKGGL